MAGAPFFYAPDLPSLRMRILPGYCEHLDTIKPKAVDEVAVISVYSIPHFMDAWAKELGGKENNTFAFLDGADADSTPQWDVGYGYGAVVGMGNTITAAFRLIIEEWVKSVSSDPNSIEEVPGSGRSFQGVACDLWNKL